MDNFWDKTHPLSAMQEHLFAQLVPGSGKCDTLQGEMLRAASKIGYDWYNNGWGCNNWSGAVCFLQANGRAHVWGQSTLAQEQFQYALREVYYFSHGEHVNITDEQAEKLVTIIMEYVVQCCINNPDPIPNEMDMFELQERRIEHNLSGWDYE